MGIIAKYKFNQEIYADFVPGFNSGFTDYTVTDKTDTDGMTIRTIESDSLPTLMRFGANAQTDREKSLLEVYECDTSNITNMYEMFRNCSSLTLLNVSNFNTEKVTNMGWMFSNCSSLTSLDVSNFNTQNVANMTSMFTDCSSLTFLDVSNFNTENVTDAGWAFRDCFESMDIGAIYCNSSTINKISESITTNTTIWYQDANPSDLTVKDNITYKKYKSTTLSLNEPIQLRSIGDVHDEINYETGEYIQRIGEIVLDGSENWTFYNSGTVNTISFSTMFEKFDKAICDKFNYEVSRGTANGKDEECYTYINDGEKTTKLYIYISKQKANDVESFKQYLQSNPIKVQYQLSQPIITKIDTTILDQNNSYKSSQQTYDEQTYVSVQSDTVVTPLSSVDYEIYSSTGTVTGTSTTIDNAEAGTPVSGVVYGETLLNVIQEPSEDEFVCTDNFSGKETTIENSVAGNVKDVIIKGQTLVSLVDSVDSNEVGNYNSSPCRINLIGGLNSETVTVIFNVISLEIPDGADGILRIGGGWSGRIKHNPTLGVNKVLYNYNQTSNSWLGVFSNSEAYDLGQRITISDVMVLEGDYTNVDVPYFEGIGSVTNYRTIENMQSTCTYSENNGTYWCDTTTVNPTVGKRYFIKIFNNPNNAITRFFYGGVIVDTTTDYGIVTATDRTGMRLHFYNLNSGTVTITEEQKNAIRFLICEYQDGMENWEINEHFEESYTVQMPILITTGKNLLNDNTSVSGWIMEDGRTTIRGALGSASDYLSDFIYVGNINQIKINVRCYVTTFDENKKIISQFANVVDVNVSNCSYIRISVSCSGQVALGLVGTIQIEEGSTATTYEPFKSTTVIVNENIELNSIGDIYDELNVTTGELTQRIGEVVLDGSQPIHGAGYIKLDDAISDWTGKDEYLLSDKLPTSVFTGSDLLTTPTLALHGGLLYVRGFNSNAEATEYFTNNPTTVQYRLKTESAKTVDLSIIDQNNVQQKYVQTYDTTTHLKPQSYELIPTVEYKNPTYNVLLKPNTEYTIKTNRTNRATLTSDVALDVNLGGSTISMDSVTNHVKVTTPSTLENNTLTLSGFGNKVKDVMVIEGDYVDRDLDFFEGFISVENPIVSTISKNLFDLHKFASCCGGRVVGDEYECINPISNSVYLFDKPYINVTLSLDITQECTSGNPTSSAIAIVFEDGSVEHRALRVSNIFNITFTSKPIIGIQMTAYCQGWKIKNIQLEKGLIRTSYEPYQGTICTTYPQITLRSIGDIKDEWDVVGETVTRRIGEVVLDGTQSYSEANLPPSADESVYSRFYIDNISNYNSDSIIADNFTVGQYGDISERLETGSNGRMGIMLLNSKLTSNDVDGLKAYLQINPITVQYRLATPITESVRITPPNPQTSSASITIPTQLNYAEDTSDFLVWNPYKEHYVRYNYVEDGVVLDNYTWENLTDLNERQFVEFYNRRTYIDQPYYSYVASHDSKGTSKYVLIEPNQDYTVNVRFSELPTCETVKVNLGGTEVEMNVNNPHVHITTPNTLANNLCSISGDGLVGKVTDILVIHCLEHEGFADIDYFEGIDGIGEIVEVDGVPKSKIVMEQTNGNLLDFEPVVFNNGNYISMGWNENHRNIPLKANTSYRLKMRKSKDVTSNNGWGDFSCKLYTSELVNTRNVGIDTTTGVAKFATTNNEKYLRFYKQQSHNGNTDIHEPLELTYAHFTDNELIRPRYYDKEEILLPIQLHRINTAYDNFYYDEMKGYYRIQQSIGHKYFVGADSENWTLIERGQRVLRFRYNNADIQMKSLGEFMTNRLPNGTATSPYECCAFNGINFIVSIDKERLSSESLTAFKEWLANNNLHLYYQLASPLMIDLPEYSSRIEFNTYKDEIYTFFKNCKPTVFTLAVPLDQTYRFYELEQGEGYANRVELTDERMTEEDTLYIDTIYGSGISNLIEEPNNVDTMLKPNYEGKATSHSLTNGKVSTIGVHGFEPNNVTISNYNTVTKQYELTVQAQQGTNTNTKVLPIPYKFEVYEDGTKDKVYYNSQYKQWMFEGGQTLTVPYNASTGAFTSAIEVFRGLQPRSGLIGEFKVRFTSGTTSVRLYYSINGTTYGYTTLRGMTDEVDYYIGFFNTGGTKIDMGTKIDANSEYTTLVPINATIPECLMINQIQSITECTYYQDKTYYYSDVVSPLVLDVYNGETIITELNGAVIDIQNNAHNKQALIYGDTTYTVYWTYVGGEGNIKVTLGGVTQEVFAPQGYVTITTGNTDLERGLLIGGFDVTIKDLMLIKGERITDLKYFEGSRAVGTAFTDEDGNTMYKITFVTGSELINDKFEDMITFEDNKKHNVVVTKLLGAKPNKN